MSTKQAFERYRVAVEAARDTTLPVDASQRAAEDATDARLDLDRELINERSIAENRSRMDDIIRPTGGNVIGTSITDPELRDFFAPPEMDGPSKRRMVLPVSTRADEEWFKDTAKTVKAGYLYTSELGDRIIYHENAASGVLASGVTRIQTAHGRTILYPVLTTDASAAQRSERAAAALTEPVFGQVELAAYSMAGHMVLTQEIQRDAEVNIWEAVVNVAGRALATKVAASVAIDDGSAKPQGLNYAATSGKTATAKTVYTYDELQDLYLSVLPESRMKGSWIFGSTAFGILLKMKDASGQPFLQPAVSADVPDTLMGKPVYEDANYPACTTGLCPVTFGDSSAYLFRDAGIAVEIDHSVYFSEFMSVVRFQHVMSGVLSDPTAVKKLTLA